MKRKYPDWAVNPEIVENNIVLPGFSTGDPLSPIFLIHGEWAITTYGIEHVSGTYYIESDRVYEPYWVNHMKDKDWVKIDDFQIALISARSLFTKTGSLKRPQLAGRVFETLADYLNNTHPTEHAPKPKAVREERTVSLRTRFQVLKRDGYKCNLCGRSNDDGVRLEIDHKTPVSKDGSNNINNLWVLCFDCNRGKHIQEI